jgi:hypothetical protein
MDQLARAAEGGAIFRDAEPPAKARRAVVANEQLRGCVAVAESQSNKDDRSRRAVSGTEDRRVWRRLEMHGTVKTARVSDPCNMQV